MEHKTLDEVLRSFLTEFEPYSKKYFEKKIKEAARYSPLIARFYKDLADFSQGGKRLRAFLVYLGYGMDASHDSKKILPIALALEIFHSFLLIHDDIIDKSDTRRGKPTIHKRYERIFGRDYGVNQAIVLGDIACFEAFNLINSCAFSDSLKVAVSKKLADVLIETGFGQALDIENSYRRAKLADIWQVSDLKTARYSFVGPLTVGAMVSNADSKQISAIGKYGENVGKAFQLQDDILGVFGDEKILGKSTISDLHEGKNTVLIYKTKELSDAKQKSQIARIWGNRRAKRSDLVTIQKIIESSGAKAWCEREKSKLASAAIIFSDNITSQSNFRKIFVELVHYAVSRQV